MDPPGSFSPHAEALEIQRHEVKLLLQCVAFIYFRCVTLSIFPGQPPSLSFTLQFFQRTAILLRNAFGRVEH